MKERPKVHLLSLREIWELKGSLLRGFGIGTVIGAIPGAGATVASFVSYGVERQVSKKPEEFGKGSWDGLNSTSSAINASTGGAMIPLLTLGIPGSGATAVMMGAFLLHGIQPGPLLLARAPRRSTRFSPGSALQRGDDPGRRHLCQVLLRTHARAGKHHGRFIIMFCLVGAYALRNDTADLWYMVIFGIGGYYMRRYDLPVPPLVLGVILGPLAERYFLGTMIGANNDISVFFTRPVSGTLIILSIALLFWPMLQSRMNRRRAVKNSANAFSGLSDKGPVAVTPRAPHLPIHRMDSLSPFLFQSTTAGSYLPSAPL